jgi:retron-type reverse transcriptase
VHELRWKLNQKAKKEPKFKFYSLYDLICRKDIIESAWKHVAKRGKAAGVDGLKAEHFLASAEKTESFLRETADLLRNKSYIPSPVLRVFIPKADGSKRPLEFQP